MEDKLLTVLSADNNPIEISNIKYSIEVGKYSSTKNPVKRMYVNEERISRNSPLRFVYKCGICERISTVSSVVWCRLLQIPKTNCYFCRNTRRVNTERNTEKKLTINHDDTLLDKYNRCIEQFESEPESFKTKFFSKHLTKEEFDNIRPRILTINGKEFTAGFKYWCIYPSTNQMKYTSVIFDETTDDVFQPDRPEVKCDNCSSVFVKKSIHKLKNAKRILCRDCGLCRKIFKRRPITVGDINIMIHSKLEEKFIKWCSDHTISVKNGPSLKYSFDDKTRSYIVDFLINDNILVEIKDSHIWHQRQVTSGKWGNKEKSARDAVLAGIYKEFLLITPDNWDSQLNLLMKI